MKTKDRYLRGGKRMEFSKIVSTVLSLSLLLSGCLGGERTPGGGLVYQAPVKVSIRPEGKLPGTDIRYRGLARGGAELSIDGQQAVKRRGDSVNWQGELGDGVSHDLTLRILGYDSSRLKLVGRARVAIHDPLPRPAPVPSDLPVVYHAPVVYSVDRETHIPGTTITYQGKSEHGGGKLGGIEGFPYRRLGDSIVWEGKLRDDAYLRLNVRTLLIREDSLKVAGIAKLCLTDRGG